MIRRNSKTNQYLKLVSFFRSYWALLACILLAVPYLIRYIKLQKAKNEVARMDNVVKVNNAQNGKSSPNIIKDKIKLINVKYAKVSSAQKERAKSSTQKIAISLGTNVEDNHVIGSFEFFNVSATTEDEETVVKLLVLSPALFPLIEDYYYSVFTRSRNLKTDIYKYLSKQEIQKIRIVYKKYGFNWL